MGLGTSPWMIGHTVWSSLHLIEGIFLLGLPFPTLSFVAYSWGFESYIFNTVYMSSDHSTSLAKAQGPIYMLLGPLSLQHGLHDV